MATQPAARLTPRGKVQCAYRTCSGKLGEAFRIKHPDLKQFIDSDTGAWLDPVWERWMIVVQIPIGYHQDADGVWKPSKGARARQGRGRAYTDPYESERHRRRYAPGPVAQHIPFGSAAARRGHESVFVTFRMSELASWIASQGIGVGGDRLDLIDAQPVATTPCVIVCPDCGKPSLATREALATAPELR